MYINSYMIYALDENNPNNAKIKTKKLKKSISRQEQSSENESTQDDSDASQNDSSIPNNDKTIIEKNKTIICSIIAAGGGAAAYKTLECFVFPSNENALKEKNKKLEDDLSKAKSSPSSSGSGSSGSSKADQNKISNLQSEISDLQDQLKNNSSDLDKRKISNLQSEISDLQDQLKNSSGSSDLDKTTISDLQSRISICEKEKTTLESQIRIQQTELDGLKKHLNIEKTFLSNEKNKVNIQDNTIKIQDDTIKQKENELTALKAEKDNEIKKLKEEKKEQEQALINLDNQRINNEKKIKELELYQKKWELIKSVDSKVQSKVILILNAIDIDFIKLEDKKIKYTGGKTYDNDNFFYIENLTNISNDQVKMIVDCYTKAKEKGYYINPGHLLNTLNQFGQSQYTDADNKNIESILLLFMAIKYTYLDDFINKLYGKQDVRCKKKVNLSTARWKTIREKCEQLFSKIVNVTGTYISEQINTSFPSNMKSNIKIIQKLINGEIISEEEKEVFTAYQEELKEEKEEDRESEIIEIRDKIIKESYIIANLSEKEKTSLSEHLNILKKIRR